MKNSSKQERESTFWPCFPGHVTVRLRFTSWGHSASDVFLFGFCGSFVLHGDPVRNRLKGRPQ